MNVDGGGLAGRTDSTGGVVVGSNPRWNRMGVVVVGGDTRRNSGSSSKERSTARVRKSSNGSYVCPYMMQIKDKDESERRGMSSMNPENLVVLRRVRDP